MNTRKSEMRLIGREGKCLMKKESKIKFFHARRCIASAAVIALLLTCAAFPATWSWYTGTITVPGASIQLAKLKAVTMVNSAFRTYTPPTDPAAEPETEPAAESETEPAAEPETEPAAEPETEPTAELEGEPEAEPVAEPETVTEVYTQVCIVVTGTADRGYLIVTIDDMEYLVSETVPGDVIYFTVFGDVEVDTQAYPGEYELPEPEATEPEAEPLHNIDEEYELEIVDAVFAPPELSECFSDFVIEHVEPETLETPEDIASFEPDYPALPELSAEEDPLLPEQIVEDEQIAEGEQPAEDERSAGEASETSAPAEETEAGKPEEETPEVPETPAPPEDAALPDDAQGEEPDADDGEALPPENTAGDESEQFEDVSSPAAD